MRYCSFHLGVVLLTVAILSACQAGSDTDRFTTWTRYEGEPGASNYSALDQIDRSNVDQLQVAWTYETTGTVDINPIIVDTIMYVIGTDDAITAVHAGTGEEIWATQTDIEGGLSWSGLVFWESADRSDQRILFGKGSYYLGAVDALTGETIEDFGDNGRVDLREGLGVPASFVPRILSQSPGVIYDETIVLGSTTGEGYIAPPGHIRGFNDVTGEQEWIFNVLPQPGEFGYETWPEGRSSNENRSGATATGGANTWGGLSVDAERGIVYVPAGSANYDFYGADRPGMNLFANSLIALDAETGERIWHFQTVHHDLWDYDLTATPVLLTIEQDDEPVDIVALASKQGFVYVFNRATGEPIWPIQELAVPPSEMAEEQAWPTQPFPTAPPPFVPQTFNIDTDFNPYLVPEERDSLREVVGDMLYMGLYTPPSTRPTLQIPGNQGGANWGSTAANPLNGTFFVAAANWPFVLHLHPITMGETGTGGSSIDRGHEAYAQQCQLCHGAGLEGSPQAGIPSLLDISDRMSDNEIEQIVRQGGTLMPAFPEQVLSERAFQGLLSFLKDPTLSLTFGQEQTEDISAEISGTVRYQSGWNSVTDSRGVPISKPPWFRLTAYDLNTGTIKWQAPIGDVSHLAEQGVKNTGAVHVGEGPAVTAGGLVFQPAANQFIAFDADTGAEIWVDELSGRTGGIPAVYQVDGRQFVVIPVDGDEEDGETSGYQAYALPASD